MYMAKRPPKPNFPFCKDFNLMPFAFFATTRHFGIVLFVVARIQRS